MKQQGTRMVILYGGRSGEHDVSRRSAAAVLANLPERFAVQCIGIRRDGRFYLQRGLDRETLAGRALLPEVETQEPVWLVPGDGLHTADGRILCDVVFPVLHGTFGEDGTIQGALEIADIPYVGADVTGSALGMAKALAKTLWEAEGLPVGPWLQVDREVMAPGSTQAQSLAGFRERHRGAVFVKPNRGGSSVGVARVEDGSDALPAIRDALEWDREVLVEAAISGRELEISVIGNGRLDACAVGEIRTRHGFYSYDAKYTDEDAAELIVPAAITDAEAETIRSHAVRACRACGIDGMARVDFFRESASGRILINEVNTIPGFTSISMYPRLCAEAGIAYPQLLTRLADLAIARHRERAAIRYSR